MAGALGLIPAHAGKPIADSQASQARTAHPRSRGENLAEDRGLGDSLGSSPLTRGKLLLDANAAYQDRLIPAHAGKTRRHPSPKCPRQAHPRSRGENIQTTVQTVAGWGSSPLTRGKQDRPRQHRGSSPLTRGKHRLDISRGEREGLIPAHAGKTAAMARAAPSSEAHPRSRGENCCMARLMFSAPGSSPLTRGKHLKPGMPLRYSRLIPAHAGKTLQRGSRPQRAEAHPRSRGENTAIAVNFFGSIGSSPLTRGKRRRPRHRARPRGLIPAHAGKTSAPPMRAPPWRAHPRSRGENRTEQPAVPR